MRRSSYLFAVSAVAVLALSGCNTMVEKSYQDIQVITPDVVGADCTLKSVDHEYRVITPGTVMVERSPENLHVTCIKANHQDGVAVLESKVKMWRSAFNVFNGVVPGTAWDVASKSIYAYPDSVTLNMAFDQAAYDSAQGEAGDPPQPVRKKEEPVEELEFVQPTYNGDKAFDGALTK